MEILFSINLDRVNKSVKNGGRVQDARVLFLLVTTSEYRVPSKANQKRAI